MDGLNIIRDGISQDEALSLMNRMDELNWSEDISRRTVQFGVRYCYKTKKLIGDVEPLPEWLQALAQRFQPLVTQPITQCIINEYRTTQMIHKHIDTPTLFGPEIVTISLGSSAVMRMRHDDMKQDFDLHSGDVCILSSDARYKWTHEILPSKDPAFLRVSITFRSIVGPVMTVPELTYRAESRAI